MKRALVFVVLMLICSVVSVQAQTWHTANQATLGWDAVAPIATGDVIKYQVYTKFGTTTAVPQKVGAEVTALQQTISFTVEGRYYPCVQTVRYPTGETVGLVSTFACSDVAADVQGGTPFGIKYFVIPGAPRNLRNAP